MTSHDLLASAVIVALLMTAAIGGIFLWLRLLQSGYFRRRRQARDDGVVEVDRAYNAMITSEAILQEMQERGFPNPQANALVQEARQAYVEGNPDEAEALSARARTTFQEALSGDHQDHAMAWDEEIPESKPILGVAFPKHFLEAKFLLGVLEGRVKRTKKDSKRGKKARDLWKEAGAAFAAENYSDALSYAAQCRRLLEGMAPKAAKSRPRCPDCGVPIQKTDDFCGKCGTNLKGSSGCRSCGAPLAKEDRFCRKCGRAVEGLAPSG